MLLSEGCFKAPISCGSGMGALWENWSPGECKEEIDSLQSHMEALRAPLSMSSQYLPLLFGPLFEWISSMVPASTRQLPFKIPQMQSNKDRKALDRGTWGDAGGFSCGISWVCKEEGPSVG